MLFFILYKNFSPSIYQWLYITHIYTVVISGHKWSTTHRVLKSHRSKMSIITYIFMITCSRHSKSTFAQDSRVLTPPLFVLVRFPVLKKWTYTDGRTPPPTVRFCGFSMTPSPPPLASTNVRFEWSQILLCSSCLCETWAL